MFLNPELLNLAMWRIGQQQDSEKQAFVPPGGDPSAGGAPPGADPSAAGGAPPGGDPSMAGGAPPGGDPSGGAAPPPGVDPAMLQQMIQQGIQQAMGGMGGGMGAAQGAPGMGKPGKPDPAAQGMDIFQIKKLMVGMYNRMGWELPPDILDGPNRDPNTGQPMPPGAPGSTSDPNRQPPPDQGQAQGGGGQDNALSQIEPMQAASLSGGGDPGAAKQGADDPALRMGTGLAWMLDQTRSRADAVASIMASMRSRNGHI